MIVRYNICFCKGSTSSSHATRIYFLQIINHFGRGFDCKDDGDGNNHHHHFLSSLLQHRPWWKVAANASDCVGQNLAQALEV